jgi:hypothetical protein
VHGRSTLFGDDVSFDCPPDPGPFVATTAVVLAVTTAEQTRTLTTASPSCRAAGFASLRCLCDVCNSSPPRACSSNADCPENPSGTPGVCGGKLCLGGSNQGAPCTANSACPSGGCSAFGRPPKPNECDDRVCTPNTPPDDASADEGICAAGPFEKYCTIETFRGCNSNTDCTLAGDTCTSGRFRDCFTDNGALGGDVVARGVANAPANGTATIVVAGLFCIPPTGSNFDNAVYGVPGLGRATIPLTATLE